MRRTREGAAAGDGNGSARTDGAVALGVHRQRRLDGLVGENVLRGGRHGEDDGVRPRNVRHPHLAHLPLNVGGLVARGRLRARRGAVEGGSWWRSAREQWRLCMKRRSNFSTRTLTMPGKSTMLRSGT
jgi:hypothetical protein